MIMKCIIGTKIGMTRAFSDDGVVIPVSIIATHPLTSLEMKTLEKHGYEATRFEFTVGKKKRTKEFKTSIAVGERSEIVSFQPGDLIKVSGLTKGRGFQGAVKRHGFHGMPASHGHHHVLRHVGSIGQRFPQHTLKGTRMAGRMGAVRKTVRGLTVVSVDAERNLLAVRGAVPGRKGSLLEIATLK